MMPNSLLVDVLSTTSLILFLAKATLLLVAALAAATWLRHGSAGARHLVWLAALVGVLALPLLSRIQSLRVPVLPSSLATPPTRVEPAIAAAAPTAMAVPVAPSLVPALAAAPKAAIIADAPVTASSPEFPSSKLDASPIAAFPSSELDSFGIVPTLLAVWAAGALGLIGWLVAGAVAVRRIVAGGRELTSPDWTTPLCEVADRLDLEVPPRLVISDRIEMAFACRATAPTIVLPKSAETWTDDRRRAVLFHELAHVKRHDLLSHLLGRVACALYWFHPLVWTAAKHLRAESERACDDLVLSCGARPSDYAQHLLDMVTSVRHHGAPVMALPMARKKEFEGRMLAILDPAVRRASVGRAQAALVVAALGALSLVVAAVAPVEATEPQAPATPPAARAAIAAAVSEAPRAVTPTLATAVPRSPRVPATQVAVPSQETVDQVDRDVRASGLQHAATTMATDLASAASSSVSAILGRRGATPAQAQDTARVSLLIRILSTDSAASVRRAAAWALHEVGTAGSRTALLKALQTDGDASVREMSAWALADHEDDAVKSALGDALLHDKSAHVRATSAWAIGQQNATREVGALESALADPDADVRRTAIWALGNGDLHKAPPRLVNGLTDADEQVRLMAAWALGQIADTTTMRSIANAFMAENDTQVRSAELRALMMKGDVPTNVLETALKSSDPELRRRAVAMLAGGSGGPWPWPWPWPRPRVSP